MEKLSNLSGVILTLEKRIKSFTNLLGLNTWLTSAFLTNRIKCIDSFYIFWNYEDKFKPDGIHLNILEARLLYSANL